MFEVKLFLGFPLDQIYSRELEKVDPILKNQFVQSDGAYLQEMTHGDMTFLGKPAGKMISLVQLDLLEENIFSLLKRLVPNYPYNETPLYLFPVQEESDQ